MKIQALLFSAVTALLGLPTFAPGQMAAPQVVGPEYAIVQQRSDYQHKENFYCGGYFILEGKTQYGGPYLVFYYRNGKNGITSDEVPFTDISIAIAPDSTAGLPKAVLVGQDAAQKIWLVSITETMFREYARCLTDVPKQNKP